MTVMGAFAGLFLKKASDSSINKKLIQNSNFYAGGGLFFFAALINIYILKCFDYSVFLPLTAITYIWTIIISNLFLGEEIGFKKLFGVSMILIGAICIAI